MIVMTQAFGLTDLEVIETFEEAARAADRAGGAKDFPALSADMVMRLCRIARRSLLMLDESGWHCRRCGAEVTPMNFDGHQCHVKDSTGGKR